MLVGVQLDDRTVVEQRAVVVVVAVGEVGVQAVGVIGRNQHRARQRPPALLGVGHDALQHLPEHRPARPGRRGAADLFMIVGHQQGGLLGLGLGQGLETDKTAQQVVEPGRGDELLFQTDEFRALGRIEKQLVVQHLGDIRSAVGLKPALEEGFQLRFFLGLPEDGRQIGLGVDRAAGVGLAVEMNGQAGNDRHGV